MHDVFGQLMVATGDEHFLPKYPVGTVDHRPGAGAQIAQGRALACFSQGHGAAEATFEHRRKKALLQLGAGKTLDQVGGTDAEKGVSH
ncbi:hypothetical protein D3C80_1971400 [compost metagenome]